MAQAEQITAGETLYFLSYAHTLSISLSEKTHIHAVKLLLEWITMFPGSENPKTGEPLIINNDFVYDLEQHKRDVPGYLKKFASKSRQVKEGVKDHFAGILKEVIPVMLPDLISNLCKLVRQSSIAASTVKKWKSTLNEKDYTQFLADVFLYALQVKDPSVGKKTNKVAADTQLVNDIVSDSERLAELCARLNILTPIPKPPEIAQSEYPFIAPLYDAYGSIDGKVYTSKGDLPPRLQKDIEIRRDHFYSAETVRIQGAKALGPIGVQEYTILEDEIFDAAYDTCFDDYKNGFVRMKKVMEHIVSVQCAKSVYSKTKWVGPAERQGICHQLAGEQRLQWVVPDE